MNCEIKRSMPRLSTDLKHMVTIVYYIMFSQRELITIGTNIRGQINVTGYDLTIIRLIKIQDNGFVPQTWL